MSDPRFDYFGRGARLPRSVAFQKDVIDTANRIRQDRTIDDVFVDDLFPKADCGHAVRTLGGPHICTLCLRDIAEEKDMFGNPGWKCGNNAAPLRDPRSQQSRCCGPCADQKVVPRRQAQMQFAYKLENANRTPFDALFYRDAVVDELIYQRRNDLVKSAADKAELVVWEQGLIAAALRGVAVFEGASLNLKPNDVPTLLVAGGLSLLLWVGEEGAVAYEFEVSTPRHPITIKQHSINRQGECDPEDKRFWAQISALLAFMEIEIVKRESGHLPRQARRDLERKGKPVPKVTVVRLRRTMREQSTGESDVEWHHRWMVRGHWRRQWYPSEQEHKPIYIAAFIKGPEGAPFLPPKEVVKVVNR